MSLRSAQSGHPLRVLSNSAASAAAMLALSFFLTACGHKSVAVKVPPAPPPPPAASPEIPQVAEAPPVRQPVAPKEPADEIFIPPDTKPIFVETGLASWYGAPYHNRTGSNGKLYDMNAMTAAHRTLPLGSIVRVTNVQTGNSALVRITDRGPFIPGRILDLSLAAAKKVDVWRPGVARIRVEVLQTPASLDIGGRWAVQIGAFDHEDAANHVVEGLSRRYHTAKVLCFPSPIGDWWVRVRVLDDDRKRAEEVARDSVTPEGAIFLVRLD